VQSSAVKISDVRYTDIQGTSASQVAVKFDCSVSNLCGGIGLRDIKLTLQCTYANHSVLFEHLIV
jgi:polygalacturonase